MLTGQLMIMHYETILTDQIGQALRRRSRDPGTFAPVAQGFRHDGKACRAAAAPVTEVTHSAGGNGDTGGQKHPWSSCKVFYVSARR